MQAIVHHQTILANNFINMANKILLIEWKSFGNEFVKEAFEHLDYEVEVS